jgi:hypothetical protein
MPDIQLIVTGDMEKLSLHEALGQAFPDIEFREPIQSQGFTSRNVNSISLESLDEDEDIYELVNDLFAAIEDRQSADMIIVVEDLEIINISHPEKVVECFHKAVKIHTQKHNITQRIRNKLKNNCSFHLVVPMTEAYFFKDKMDGSNPAALNRAGAVLQSTVLGNQIDVENFKVINHTYQGVDYLTSEGSSYWAKTLENRDKHPKKYLDYLCCPKTDKKTCRKRRYRETKGGVNALKALDWDSVFSGNSNQVKFLRSLFHDIAWKFNLQIPYQGKCASITEYIDKKNRVLRNI